MSKPTLLIAHPSTPATIPRPWVRFDRDGALLRMMFRIPGDTSAILFPDRVGPRVKQSAERRRDRLWEHTCFEAFIRPADSKDYVEFNFSPSSEWAAYRFDGYRDGMRNADIPVPAVIATNPRNRFELSALVQLREWEARPWLLNFAAVIEERDGAKSYWALAHPDGPPDFHDPDCFVLELPPSPLA